MKKITLFVLMAFLVCACGQRAKKVAAVVESTAAAAAGAVGTAADAAVNTVTGATRSVVDSIRMLPDAGPMVMSVYSGQIPAASNPGQKLRLTLYHQQSSPFGVYHLTTTYLQGGPNGADRIEETSGEWGTVKGENYPVWVLTDYVTRDKMNFVVRDGAIDMLDEMRKPINSKLNYTLTREVDNARVSK